MMIKRRINLSSNAAKRFTIFAFTAIFISALTIGLTTAYAQKHGGGGSHSSGGDSGCSGCDAGGGTEHSDSDHSGGKGAKGAKGGKRGGQFTGRGGRSQSLSDIFRELESPWGTDQHSSSTGDEHTGSVKRGGSASRGKRGN